MARHEISAQSRYIIDLFAREDEVLQNTRNSIEDINLRAIQIAADEGKLINLLLKMIQAKRVIEVGTLAAYSTIWIARALPDDGEVYTIEKSKENYDNAMKNISSSDVKNKVKIFHGDGLEALENFGQYGVFDAIFIDANKAAYPMYLDYADKYLKKGGLIIGDNTFQKGGVYNDKIPSTKGIEGMKEFNKRLSNDHKYDAIIIPTTEGMTVALKK